jgi:hypothetical protein
MNLSHFSFKKKEGNMYTRYNKLLFFILLVAVSIVFPAIVLAETHTRDNWYIGFGLGGALDARYEVDGEDISFHDFFAGAHTHGNAALNFKVGGTIDSNNLLGFDATFVRQEGTYGSAEEESLQISNYFLMFTHFPSKEGLFFRGGGGFSNITYESRYYGMKDELEANGYGILAGIGYAFWVGKSFNLTINLDHSRQFYTSGDYNYPSNSQFTTLYLGFDWY